MKTHLLILLAAIALLGANSTTHAQNSFMPEVPPISREPAPTPMPVTPQDQPDSTAQESAPMVAASLSSMEALDNTSKLHIGDTISFRIIEDRDAPVTRFVTDSGEIEFPYVGRIKAQDKTCRELAYQLKKILEVHYYEKATVIIGIDHMANQMTPRDYVWLIGETRAVGPQQISPSQPMTLSQIILKAGGFGAYADERHVRLVHYTSTPPPKPDSKSGSAKPAIPADPTDSSSDKSQMSEQTVDVKAVLEGKSTVDPIVSAGDKIIVKKRFINF